MLGAYPVEDYLTLYVLDTNPENTAGLSLIPSPPKKKLNAHARAHTHTVTPRSWTRSGSFTHSVGLCPERVVY